MIIKNETEYPTKELRRLFSAGLRIFRKMEKTNDPKSKELAVRVYYRRRRFGSNLARGYAYYGKVYCWEGKDNFFGDDSKFLVQIGLPRPDKECSKLGSPKHSIVYVFTHELYHTQGWRHRNMAQESTIRGAVEGAGFSPKD